MNDTRIYQEVLLLPYTEIRLNERNSHYIIHVLRAEVGDEFILFNGFDFPYKARILQIAKSGVKIKIEESIPSRAESNLQSTLIQGIARNDKMDFIIQKATELGVSKIVPIITERCQFHHKNRFQKKIEHWHNVAVSACEQSGRYQIPTISPIIYFEEFIKSLSDLEMKNGEQMVLMSPTSSCKINSLTKNQVVKSVSLLVGPEGGLSDEEVTASKDAGFALINFGPRILRTETASIVGLTLLQNYFGDM